MSSVAHPGAAGIAGGVLGAALGAAVCFLAVNAPYLAERKRVNATANPRQPGTYVAVGINAVAGLVAPTLAAGLGGLAGAAFGAVATPLVVARVTAAGRLAARRSAQRAQLQAEWRVVGEVFDGQPMQIEGVDPWRAEWAPRGAEPVDLPHPTSLDETASFQRYVLSHAGRSVCVAAARLSDHSWGFYTERGDAS
ncbi:MAG: hypothetical protein AAF790_13890 [Planctomycetota bacterium]